MILCRCLTSKCNLHPLRRHFPQLQRALALALCFFLNVASAVAAKGSVLDLEVKDAIQFRSVLSASQDEVHEEIAGVVEMLAPLVKMLAEVPQKQNEIVIGLMTGRIRIAEIPDKALHLSERHREMFLFSAELLAIMAEDFGGKPSSERGYAVGRGLFEAGSIFVAPEVVAGKLTKLKFLEAMKLKAGTGCKWLSAAGVAKLEALLVKLRASRMCFVAGTPVWTADGLRAIEDIVEKEMVLTRDEVSGRQEYRPVVGTIVTHPAALVHVRYAGHSRHGGGDEAGNGDASEDEELVCTAEHPFYVGNRAVPGFVLAGELMAGDEFQLADGGVAEVSRLRREMAAEGRRFTTYNLEVADFHTYFVGGSGVWVHNFSTKFCEDFFTLTKEIQKAMGIAEGAETGKRLEIVKTALRTKKFANKEEAAALVNQTLHTVSREELLATSDSRLIPTVEDLRAARIEFKADYKGDFSAWNDIHHLWEKWATDMLDIDPALKNKCPGLVMPRRPNEAFFDAAQYAEKWGEAPIYHQDLSNALQTIRLKFTEPVLSPQRKTELISDVQKLYESDSYKSLNMWPATRDWLSRQPNIGGLLP